MTEAALGLVIILAVMLVLFASQIVAFDLTALGVLLILILCNYVSPDEAFKGFSSPVTIALVCTYVLASAIRNAGIADWIGKRIVVLAKNNEAKAIFFLMLPAAFISAFMNNVAATALMLPAAAYIIRETELSSSRFFIPLAFGATFGGMTTLVGTPPNLLAGELFRQAIGHPLRFNDFFIVGTVVVIIGSFYVAFFGRKLLPERKNQRRTKRVTDLRTWYRVDESLYSVRIPHRSNHIGKSLAELQIGKLLSLDVHVIFRGSKRILSPRGSERVEADSLLVVRGASENLEALGLRRKLEIAPLNRDQKNILRSRFKILSAQKDFSEHGQEVILLGIERAAQILGGEIGKELPQEVDYRPGDIFYGLIEKDDPVPDYATEVSDLDISRFLVAAKFSDSLSLDQYPDKLHLSLLGLLDGTVLSVIGKDSVTLSRKESAGEIVLVRGSCEVMSSVKELSELSFESESRTGLYESSSLLVSEAIVPPRSQLIGKSLVDLEFRNKFDCQALVLWRDGKPITVGIGTLPLEAGDALLVQGEKDAMKKLDYGDDLLILETNTPVVRKPKDVAISLLGLFLLAALPLLTSIPSHVAAYIAACVIVFSGALKIDQLYKEVDWRVVILLALLVPIGDAVDHSGMADMIASWFQSHATAWEPTTIFAFLIIFGSVVSQLVDGVVAVALLGPISLSLAAALKLPPEPFLLAPTFGASLSFLAPFSSRSNLLVLGVGGYKSADYLKMGGILTGILVVVISVMLRVLYL